MTSRTVYSSDKGRICPGCGWPASNCQCSNRSANAAVPARIVAKLRMEKKGRGGEMVTVIDGLPRHDAVLRDLPQELKRSCGTGGGIAGRGNEAGRWSPSSTVFRATTRFYATSLRS